MPVQSPPPRRRHLRLKEYDYRQTGAYFVTICTSQRACIFGKITDGRMELNDFGQIVLHCWQHLPDHFPKTTLDAFVIMPNHVHGIIFMTDDYPVGARHASPLQQQQHTSPTSQRPSLGTLVGSFKSASTRQIRTCAGLPDFPVWQRNYYEHIIRHDESLARIQEYIVNNPLSWHLDGENQGATGQDDFDRWLASQKSVPVKKTRP